MQSPQLVNNLIGVLIRFYPENVALVTVIELMLYQVMMVPKVRNALQIFWWFKEKNDPGFKTSYPVTEPLARVFVVFQTNL